jgi:signal recognition particle receptor subunit beta
LTTFYKNEKIQQEIKNMFINHTTKEITAKIVYYGPGLSGKTTNLQYIFSITNPKSRGELVSLETKIERTLFFDLLPINVGLIKDYKIKFQLYTVPGQIFYDSTRKLVLKKVDGIVFVIDSQVLMEQANLESFENLKRNLKDQNIDIYNIPFVFQFNKRDLKNIIPISKLNSTLNKPEKPYFEAISSKGHGVIETLREISSITLVEIKKSIDHSYKEKLEKTIIDFDTNKGKEIIKKDKLPLKKIPMEHSGDLPPDEITFEEDTHDFPEKEISDLKNKKKIESEKSSTFSILDNLGDKSRITILKKIRLKEPELLIELKDKNSNLLDSMDFEINPEIKKITIILDVKK